MQIPRPSKPQRRMDVGWVSQNIFMRFLSFEGEYVWELITLTQRFWGSAFGAWVMIITAHKTSSNWPPYPPQTSSFQISTDTCRYERPTRPSHKAVIGTTTSVIPYRANQCGQLRCAHVISKPKAILAGSRMVDW